MSYDLFVRLAPETDAAEHTRLRASLLGMPGLSRYEHQPSDAAPRLCSIHFRAADENVPGFVRGLINWSRSVGAEVDDPQVGRVLASSEEMLW